MNDPIPYWVEWKNDREPELPNVELIFVPKILHDIGPSSVLAWLEKTFGEPVRSFAVSTKDES